MAEDKSIPACADCGKPVSRQSVVRCVSCHLKIARQPYNERRQGSNVKLTDEIAAEIKRRGIAGDRPACIAADYGVTEETASRIINGRQWKHIHVSEQSLPLPEGKSEYRIVPSWDNYAVGKDGTCGTSGGGDGGK